MPTIGLPARYRSPYGTRSVLTPPDSAPPGFNPDDPNDGMDGQNVDYTGSAMPGPAAIPQSATNGAAPGTSNTVSLASPALNGKPESMRKFRLASAAPSMPPPEAMEPPPQPTGTSTPAPSPAANATTPISAGPAPETASIGMMDRTPAGITPPPSGGVVAPTPPTTSDERRAAIDAERPQAFHDNWAQRFGRAILSLTKFAPAANMLMHPKWSEQEAAYQRDMANEAQREQLEQTQAGTEALGEQRAAQAAYRTAQAEQQGALADTRKRGQEEKTYKDFVDSLGKGAQQIPATQEIPEGFYSVADPRNPSTQWVLRTPFVTVPDSMLDMFPGQKSGFKATVNEFDQALKDKRDQMKEDQKAGNRPDKTMTPQQRMAAIAAGVPANKSIDELTQPEAQRLNAELAKQAQATHITNNTIIPGMPPAPGPGQMTGGEDYLKTLPVGVAAQVKAIAEGRAALPSGATRSQAAQQLRNAVFTYDPLYSDQRAQIRKSFATGPDGRNIGSLNTATVHLDQLGDAAEALKNGTFTPGNAAYNYFASMFGGAAPSNFESLKSAVAGELANALKGQATDIEIRTIGNNIMSAKSPEQLGGAVDTNLHILGAKLKTYQERYQQQIPNDPAWSPVLPSARRIYQKHGFDPTGETGGGKVRMLRPGGATPVEVDASQVEHYKKLGAKVVQ